MRPRDIRGGGDGSGALGSGGGGGGGSGPREEVISSSSKVDTTNDKSYSTSGESCVRYLGGPMRSYTGKAMRSAIL